MGDLDYLGADGGKLAMAFAAGCIATVGFMSAVGSFIWKTIGGHRKDRISELQQALEQEKLHCHDQLLAMSGRIQQLETIVTLHTGMKLAGAIVDGAPDRLG